MSATILKDRLVRVLDEEAMKLAEQVLGVRRSAGATRDGAQIMPPSTTDDIAMMVLEANAFRRGIEAARNALIDEYRKLVDPESIKIGLREEEVDEPVY